MRVVLACNGVVGSTIETVEAVTAVGSGKILNDADAGTYLQWSGFGNGRSPFEASPVTLSESTVQPVEIVLDTTFAPSQEGLGVSIFQYGFGQLSAMSGGTAYVGDDGHLHCPQVVAYPYNLAQAANGATSAVVIIGITGGSGKVYEAWVVVGAQSEAPPCRLFPRGDGLGVGGGRHFPPPKSQQRSGRRFGYY